MNDRPLPTRPAPPWRGLLLASLLCLVPASMALADALYRPPNMDKEIFDGPAVELGKFDKAGLVSNLVAVARDFDEADHDVDYELRAHALAIAGRIAPDHKGFKDTDQQLKDRGSAIGEDKPDKSRVASRIYSGVRALMRAKDNEDNKKCAAYTADIALRLDPGNKYADKLKATKEELKTAGFKADWSGMLGAAITPEDVPFWLNGGRASFAEREEKMPGGKADKFASKQTAIYGLVVVTLGNGKHAGAASSIIATALREEGLDGLSFQLNQKVGPMMANSLESIVNYLRVKYEDTDKVPDGYKIDIVFEDKDQPVDGPSAGTAMALMLDALFSGEKLDQKFACTGGITPNGKVTRIGGVAAKIRGATRRDCNIVGVPVDNAKGVNDILVLKGLEQLLDIQVFTMKDFQQAHALSRKEKSPEVQETLDAFNEVANLIKEEGEDLIKNSAVQKKLEAVLEKMPNHRSAQLILDYARGKAPERLSVGGSFHEIDTNASGVLGRSRLMVRAEKYDHSKSVVEDAKEAVDELEKLEDIVDKRMEDYHKFALRICKKVYEGREDDDEEEFLEDLKEDLDDFRRIREKLLEDPELREEIGI